MTLYERVGFYISLQQEGPSWDFKREWHDNQGKLLHDIICMANSLSDESGIIIIGVDEEDNYNIRDVSSDLNRKKTQDIVTFLRDKKFAGGNRPIAHIESFTLQNKTIDVLVVEKSDRVPFYLSDSFQCVRANHIYTRVGDTNTPVDRSADPDKIEALWRIHFGLDKSALERFIILLDNPLDWDSVDGEESFFNKLSPEFQFITERDETRNGREYYCFSQMNSTSSWYHVKLLYHSTVIANTSGVCLDSGNFFSVVPKWNRIDRSPLYTYTKGSISHALNVFFNDRYSARNSYGCIQWNSCIPTFESEDEKRLFFNYLKETHYMSEKRKELLKSETDSMYVDYLVAVEVTQELDRWRQRV